MSLRRFEETEMEFILIIALFIIVGELDSLELLYRLYKSELRNA